MKKKLPYLSPTEYEFMKILWNSEKPLAVADILARREEGTWSKNSVHPLLNSLLDKGFIEVSGVVKATKANSRLYKAKILLSEYTSSQVNKVFENNTFKFNIPVFLSNLLGTNEDINEELVGELENWLEDYKAKEKE